VSGSIPFIAIIGGFYALESPEAALAQKAAEALGAEMAAAGLGLVVYLSDPESLEPHVVRGFVAAGTSRPGSIRVRYSQSQLGKVQFAEEATRKELFDARIFPGTDWEAPFYRSLAEEDGVDGVLLLSGGQSTLIAGHIAVARGLPVLAVPDHGGAAQKIWAVLAARTPPDSLSTWQPGTIQKPLAELRSRCEEAQRLRRRSDRRAQRETLLDARRQTTLLCATSFALLLAMFIYAIAWEASPRAFRSVSFLSLICAGATGALGRTLMSTTKAADPLGVLTLGGIAGFVVGLAYLIPQWISAQGFLIGSAVAVTDKIAVASAMLVAISAGVGFDAVFRKLRQDVEERSVRLQP
jgi:hypothetical protein